MRTFPQSPNPHDGNGVFRDGAVKGSDPGGKHYYTVTSLSEGPRDLLAGGSRSPADRRVLVVYEQKSHAMTQSREGKAVTEPWFVLEQLRATTAPVIRVSPIMFYRKHHPVGFAE